jgi:type IV pilus assembly protein PilM
MSRSIGVEVSSSAVRMAAIASKRGRRRLVRYGEVRLPPGAVIDGIVTDREAVRKAITTCMENGRFRPSRVTGVLRARVSVAGLRAIVRELEMPPLPAGEVDAAVRLQASEVIPFPADRTLLSARKIERAPNRASSGLATATRVVVAAAHRDLVEPVVEVVTDAGIVVDGVDLAASALLRALAASDEQSDEAEAIVAVGAEVTTVVIHERGEPTFVRTIAKGGNGVTRAIATALDLPFPDAEALKRRIDVTTAMSNGVPPEAGAAAREGSGVLVAEIRNSIDYYSALEGRSAVSRIVLTGGGALLSGFLERLQYQTTADVVVGDWTQRVHVGRIGFDRIALQHGGAVVIGLALPERQGRKRLNLIPPETTQAQRIQRTERGIWAAAVAVLLGFIAGGAYRYVQVDQAETGVGSLDGEIAVLRQQIPQYDVVAKQDASINSDEALGKPLVSHEVNWPAVLAGLARYTPSNVNATNFVGTASAPVTAATPASSTRTSTSSGSSGSSTTASSSSTSNSAAPGTSVTGATTPPAAPSPLLPASSATIGTVSLSFEGPGYPSFQQWFDAMLASNRFEITQFSGVANPGSGTALKKVASTGVSFTAELAITGALHTDRLGEFEVNG